MKKRTPNSRRRRRGFTLMEVLLVVAILLILASLATVAISRTLKGTQAKQAKIDISTLSQAINVYFIDVGSYPPTLDALVVQPDGLANPQKWNGSYLEKELPADPWNNQYLYSINGDQIQIKSMGPDGIADTQDDIFN
jgi:general secretion pathway protein G